MFVTVWLLFSLPFFAILMLALRTLVHPQGKGRSLPRLPAVQAVEPQFSGAEKTVNRGACLTAADVALYNAHRFATGSDLSIGDMSISRIKVGNDPF